MNTDNERDVSTTVTEMKFPKGKRPVLPLPALSSPRTEDETQMQLHELEAQRGKLEIRNAELLQAMNETEKVPFAVCVLVWRVKGYEPRRAPGSTVIRTGRDDTVAPGGDTSIAIG